VTRAVFFDAGHTLLYAYPSLGSIYEEVTASLGAQVSPERFLEAFVPAYREGIRSLGGEVPANDAGDHRLWREITRRIHDRIPEMAKVDFEAWFLALYRRFGEARSWRCYDDVAPLLGRLRERGLGIGVISNWDTRLRGILKGLGLDRFVDVLLVSSEVGVRKPDPRIFRMALERTGVRAEEAVHVGDLAEEDAEGARRAGLGAVLIDRDARISDREPPPGVRVIRSLRELPELL
jgi:putative hydrolase of the HAD superfamily